MGSFLGNIGNAIKKAVSNPLQPLTHAAGEAAGVTANLKNGVHIDPIKLLTTAEAIGGNPAAMASVAGNLAGTVGGKTALGEAGVGKVGNVVGKVGEIAAPMTGGLGALRNIPGLGLISKIPGASAVESGLSKIPGASSLGSFITSKLGGGSDPSATGNPYGDSVGNANVDYGSGTPSSAASPSAWQRILGFLGGGAGGAGGAGGSGSGGINPLVLEGLAAANGVSSAMAAQRQGNLQDQALNTAKDSYATRAPLRTAGMAGMQAAPVRLNLPSTGNPFAVPSTQGT
jgi:hypothetical protein